MFHFQPLFLPPPHSTLIPILAKHPLAFKDSSPFGFRLLCFPSSRKPCWFPLPTESGPLLSELPWMVALTVEQVVNHLQSGILKLCFLNIPKPCFLCLNIPN